MAYSDIISRRLERRIERLLGRNIDVSTNPKLGDPPLGFDNFGLEELLGRINGKDGFLDVLKDPVTAAEVTAATKFNALVASIVSKSSIQTLAAYEARQHGLVQLALSQALAAMSPTPVDPGGIPLSDPISKYLPPSPSAVDALRDRLNHELRKFLLSEVRSIDLNGTVLRAIDLTVARMLA